MIVSQILEEFLIEIRRLVRTNQRKMVVIKEYRMTVRSDTGHFVSSQRAS